MSRKLWVKDGKLLTCNGALVFADVCPCRKVYLRKNIKFRRKH